MTFTLLNPIFWLQFVYFLFAVFVTFYIPGSLLTNKYKLSPLPKTIINIVIGMVLWGWQALIFGYLNLRFLSYIYLLILFLLWYKRFFSKQMFRPTWFKKVSVDRTVLLLLFIGTFLQVSIVFLNGITFSDGMYFCCGEVSDNIYQLELTQSVIDRIPPYEQLMHGIVVKNYHYWGNIVVGELVRVFRIDLLAAQFQFFPLLLSLFLGLFAIGISQLLKLPALFTRWLLFFLYFGGDLIYVFQFAVLQKIDLSMGPIENGLSFLMNFPRAFAIVVLLAGFCLFILWSKKKDIYTGILSVFVLSSVVGFKVYVGMLVAGALAFVTLVYFLQKRFRMVIPFIIFVTLSAAVFLPVNKSSGGLLWAGFWRFEDFIVHPKLGLSNLELARRIFLEHNNFLRALSYDLLFMAIYVIAIFGTKIIGLFQTKKSLSLFPKEVHIFLLSGMGASFLLGGFFFQRVGTGNEFNFIVTVYILSSYYAALASTYLFSLIRPQFLKVILIAGFVLLTLPRVIYEEGKYMKLIFTFEGYKISKDGLAAMQYLREKTQPGSLLLVDSTEYLTALGKRPIYVANTGKADLHGVMVSRESIVNALSKENNPHKAYDALYNHNIQYIYTVAHSDKFPSSASASFLQEVYRNNGVKILKFTPTHKPKS